MELPSKNLEQIAINTRHKTQSHLLMFMNKSILEKHLSQPLLTNKKQFKIAVTFVSGNIGFINVTTKNTESIFI